jgi:hypothetical protein
MKLMQRAGGYGIADERGRLEVDRGKPVFRYFQSDKGEWAYLFEVRDDDRIECSAFEDSVMQRNPEFEFGNTYDETRFDYNPVLKRRWELFNWLQESAKTRDRSARWTLATQSFEDDDDERARSPVRPKTSVVIDLEKSDETQQQQQTSQRTKMKDDDDEGWIQKRDKTSWLKQREDNEDEK